MGQPQQAQHAVERRRLTRRWILGAAAPGWFRRIWSERARAVPKRGRVDLDRMRRIAYL